MPWLAATALLHSCSVLAARNALRAWTVMLGVVAFSMSMIGTFLVRSGILTSVHAFAVDPRRGSFILVLLAIYIGGALLLFGLRASTVTEGERFAVTSREGALVFNNVMLSSILAITLLGTLYPLVTEAMGVKVSVGPPYFTPVSAMFALPMLLVLFVGPLLRWRRDKLGRASGVLALPLLVTLGFGIWAFSQGVTHLLPLLGLAIGPGVVVASVLPLRGRNLRRAPLSLWGMVVAHVGLGICLFGMASDSAFSVERLVAARVGEPVEVGPWQIRLDSVAPIAGPNWTAMEGVLKASYKGGKMVSLTPQSRTFWAPLQTNAVSALYTRWNGQLYTVLGEQTTGENGQDRWQLRLWWKPFVPLIWIGGLLVALGGALALLSRVAQDVKRRHARVKGDFRRDEVAKLEVQS